MSCPEAYITVKRESRWRFPEDRFVEYGFEDESYCRAAQYGEEVNEPQTVVMPLIQLKRDGRWYMQMPCPCGIWWVIDFQWKDEKGV